MEKNHETSLQEEPKENRSLESGEPMKPEEMAKMVEQMTQGIDDEIQAQYQRILEEYGDVFTSEERRTMGR